VAGEAKCTMKEWEAWEGRNELGSRNMDDARIEDWRGNRGTLAEARRILKESVENRRGLDAVGEDSGGVV
jgi:hypothetical protein